MPRTYRAIIRHGLKRGLKSKAGFSRRDFLKRAAGSAAAVMIGASLAPLSGCRPRDGEGGIGRRSDTGRGMKVIVVGAGFGGLAAAETLLRGGAEVTVLEALNRPGGRVHTNRNFVSGQAVEMGGEFIGENHPTWNAYARHFNLSLQELPEYDGDEVVLLDDQPITDADLDALYEEIDSILAKVLAMAEPINAERPWESPDATALDMRSLGEFIREQEISDRAKRLMLLTEEANNGVPADQMSLLGYLSMIKGGGLQDYFELSETHRLEGGNDQLAKALVKALGDRVVFNAPVTRIRREAGRARVITADRREYTGDAVILAVPPTQWPKIDFGYPVERLPQMGSNVKCILRLNAPVWEEAGVYPDVVSNDLAQLTWISAEAPDARQWGYTLFSGAEASEQWRKMAPRERVRAAVASLNPVLPTLSDTIEASMFVDWPTMSRFGGSYTFPAPGQVTQMGPTLVDGIKDGMAPLLFAGEHTSYAFIGYMEGALSSGVRAARSLLQSRKGVAATA